MTHPHPAQKLSVALKEWAIVTDFLAEGKCALLLRKGGIHEDEGPGRFHLEHDSFALFPAWEHERLDWIKPSWLPEREKLKLEDGHLAVPETLEFKGWAQVAKVWKIPSRAAFDSLDDLHPWGKPQVDMRFNYKSDQPLYLVAVRAHKFAQPVKVPNRASFAGCRSWVPLEGEDAMTTAGSAPAMTEAQFAEVLARVEKAMG